MTELKHYRYGSKITHIGCEVLPNGNDISVVIDNIKYVEGVMINGEKKDDWICTFKPNPYFTLPMVLNITNRKRIARFLGKPYVELVKDMPVFLTKEMDKAFGGGRDWGLRIGKVQPKVAATKKPVLTPESTNWAQIVGWVKDGNEIKSVSMKYDISAENLKKLEDESKRGTTDSGSGE